MSLGTITSLAANGQEGSNVICKLISVVGDDAYPAGGTPGFAALVSAQLAEGNLTLLAVIPQECGDNVPSYDAANDTLFVRVMSTGAEAAGDQSSATYNLLCVCE